MKKYVLCLAALLLFLTACKTEPVQPTTTGSGVSATVVVMTTGENGETDAPAGDMSSPTTTPPFTKKPLGEWEVLPVSAQLAKLIQEDGSGAIHFGMTTQEIQAVLEAEKIVFIENDDSFYFEDGSILVGGYYYGDSRKSS